MSKRRQGGERVRLVSGAGMCGEAWRLPATIQPEPDDWWSPCLLECGDPDCREWVAVLTDADLENHGVTHSLYHVSECQMRDLEEP